MKMEEIERYDFPKEIRKNIDTDEQFAPEDTEDPLCDETFSPTHNEDIEAVAYKIARASIGDFELNR